MNATPDLASAKTPLGFVEGLQNRLSRQFQLQVADWRETCRELSRWEDAHLVEEPRPGALAEHAAMIDELERFGQWIETTLTAGAFDGSELSDLIRGTLLDLRDSRALWHGAVSGERKIEILRDCFGEPSDDK